MQRPQPYNKNASSASAANKRSAMHMDEGQDQEFSSKLNKTSDFSQMDTSNDLNQSQSTKEQFRPMEQKTQLL